VVCDPREHGRVLRPRAVAHRGAEASAQRRPPDLRRDRRDPAAGARPALQPHARIDPVRPARPDIHRRGARDGAGADETHGCERAAPSPNARATAGAGNR
jgi:hypothetical protein